MVGDEQDGLVLQITVFKKQDEKFIHLPVISERGEMLSNHVLLTQVRVEP